MLTLLEHVTYCLSLLSYLLFIPSNHQPPPPQKSYKKIPRLTFPLVPIKIIPLLPCAHITRQVYSSLQNFISREAISFLLHHTILTPTVHEDVAVFLHT